MKIIKKKGGKFKIEHNKKLFWVIILLIILLILLIYFIVKNNKKTDIAIGAECSVDSNCVPVCGCHPESCIPIEQKEECPNMFCSQVCSGPLDCLAGSCRCIKGKCKVIANK